MHSVVDEQFPQSGITEEQLVQEKLTRVYPATQDVQDDAEVQRSQPAIATSQVTHEPILTTRAGVAMAQVRQFENVEQV